MRPEVDEKTIDLLHVGFLILVRCNGEGAGSKCIGKADGKRLMPEETVFEDYLELQLVLDVDLEHL